MKNKKNLLMVLFILFAAYFSLNGITYEKAILDNTMEVCCDNKTCNAAWCGLAAQIETDPYGTWVETCWDCADYWGGEIWCKTTDDLDYCKYWGNGVITDCPPDPVYDPLTVTISGPSYVEIPPKGTVSYATYTANTSGGDGSNSYSWSVAGASISSTSGATCTISRSYAPNSFTGSISVTVSSGDNQTASATKSIYFGIEP